MLPPPLAPTNSTPDDGYVSGITCEELPAWGAGIGVMMGVFGSIGINVGQNMQAQGLSALPDELKTSPHKSKMWLWGMGIFVSFSMLNFAALALAPASILTPLESIQFVTNIAYNKVINKATISWPMLAGTAITVLGTVFTVVFGPPGGGCHSVEMLEEFWTRPVWWVYLVVTLSIAAAALFIHLGYARKVRVASAKEPPGEMPRHHAIVLPVTFTLYSALAGGAQMIVHSKVFSELLSLIFQVRLLLIASDCF